jgi:hypothetical protein
MIIISIMLSRAIFVFVPIIGWSQAVNWYSGRKPSLDAGTSPGGIDQTNWSGVVKRLRHSFAIEEAESGEVGHIVFGKYILWDVSPNAFQTHRRLAHSNRGQKS